MDTTISTAPPEVDLTDIFFDLKEKHRNVFIQQFGSLIIIYRSIGRKEYRTIVDDKIMNDFQKENVICEICTLYPQKLNFNELDAGIPTKLADMIIRNSFLDSIEARRDLLGYYRAQMYDLDNQISCLINEAFPQYDIEDIEEWDVDKTTKYLSRAEWKLHNLRGLQFVEPEGTFGGQAETQQIAREEPRQRQESQRVQANNDRGATSDVSIRGQNKGTSKLTPEKLKEMEEFAKKFPELNVFEDSALKEGIDGLRGEGTLSPALKTPSMW